MLTLDPPETEVDAVMGTVTVFPAGPMVMVLLFTDNVCEMVVTEEPVVSTPVALLYCGAGTFSVKLAPEVVWVMTPEEVMEGPGMLTLKELFPMEVMVPIPAVC